MPLFMPKQSKEISPKRRYIKTAIFVALGLIALSIVAFAFILFYKGSAQHIESIANQLEVGRDWQAVSSQTEPPRIACLGDNPCPSVHRAWKTGSSLSRAELSELLQASGWGDFSIDNDCLPKKNVQGFTTVCGASGSRDGFSVKVFIDGSVNTSDAGMVTLSIRPE